MAILLATMFIGFNSCSKDDDEPNYSEINNALKQYENSVFIDENGYETHFGEYVTGYPNDSQGIGAVNYTRKEKKNDTEYYTWLGFISYALKSPDSGYIKPNNFYTEFALPYGDQDYYNYITLVSKDEIHFGIEVLKRVQ